MGNGPCLEDNTGPETVSPGEEGVDDESDPSLKSQDKETERPKKTKYNLLMTLLYHLVLQDLQIHPKILLIKLLQFHLKANLQGRKCFIKHF
jgi:hypothetical protein